MHSKIFFQDSAEQKDIQNILCVDIKNALSHLGKGDALHESASIRINIQTVVLDIDFILKEEQLEKEDITQLKEIQVEVYENMDIYLCLRATLLELFTILQKIPILEQRKGNQAMQQEKYFYRGILGCFIKKGDTDTHYGLPQLEEYLKSIKHFCYIPEEEKLYVDQVIASGNLYELLSMLGIFYCRQYIKQHGIIDYNTNRNLILQQVGKYISLIPESIFYDTVGRNDIEIYKVKRKVIQDFFEYYDIVSSTMRRKYYDQDK